MKKYFKIGIICGIAIAIAVSLVFIPLFKTVEPQLANPASKYCIEHGGVSAIQTDDKGAQQGICQFPNGSVCDEWKYFRGECKP